MAQRILLLEDDFQFARDMQRALNTHGYEVQTARLASEAIAKFEQTPPDLVISDMFVTQNDQFIPDGGLMLITHIRRLTKSQRKFSKTPILVISGGVEIKGGYSPLRSALSAGADMALAKPFPLPELVVRAQVLLDKDSYFYKEKMLRGSS